MIRKIVPHISLTLAAATLAFLVFYHFNPGIFATVYYQVVLFLFCIFAAISSLLLIIANRGGGRSK
jgi:hypothetical protein